MIIPDGLIEPEPSQTADIVYCSIAWLEDDAADAEDDDGDLPAWILGFVIAPFEDTAESSDTSGPTGPDVFMKAYKTAVRIIPHNTKTAMDKTIFNFKTAPLQNYLSKIYYLTAQYQSEIL